MEMNNYLDIFNVDLNDDNIINLESTIADMNRQQFSIIELVEKLRLVSVLPGQVRKSLLVIGGNNSKKKKVNNLLSRRATFPDNFNNERDLHQSTIKSVSIEIRSKMTTSIICHEELGNLNDHIVSTICLQHAVRHRSSKALIVIDADKITNLSLSDISFSTSLIINAFGELAFLFFSENDTVDYLNIINLLSSLNNKDSCKENSLVVEFITAMKGMLTKYQNKIIINSKSLTYEDISRQRMKDIVTVLEDFTEVEFNPNFNVNLPEKILSLINDGCEKLITNYHREIIQDKFINSKTFLDSLNTIQQTISELNVKGYMNQCFDIFKRKLETLVVESNVVFQNLWIVPIDAVGKLADEMAVYLSKLYESQVLNSYNDISFHEFLQISQEIDSKIEMLTSQVMQKDEIFPDDILLLVRLQVMERIRSPYLPITTTDSYKTSPVVAELCQRLRFKVSNMNAQLREVRSSIESKDPMMTVAEVININDNSKYETLSQSIEVMFSEWIQLLHMLTLIEKYKLPISHINIPSHSNRVDQLISLFLDIQTTLLDDHLGLIHKVSDSTASANDRKLLFALITFLRLATIQLVCDYFPYYQLHSIYYHVIKTLSLTILHLLTSIDQYLLHNDFSKMTLALQFLSELRTEDDAFHNVLTETLDNKVELINEKLKGILAIIKSCCDSNEIPDYQSIVQNYAYLIDALCVDDIFATESSGKGKIINVYVTEAQVVLNKYWKNCLQLTLQDIETSSFEKLKVDIDRLDAMAMLTTVLSECEVDIAKVVSVMDKKLRLLEFIDISIFIPLQYDKINDFFSDLIGWLSFFQSFQDKPLFTNPKNWMKTKLESLTDLYNNIVQDVKKRIEFLKENISKGIDQLSCEPIKQSLDELQNMKLLEDNLSRSDINVGEQYERLKVSIKDKLEQVVQEADDYHEKKEINKYNEMKLFLARTILFSHHITGCDVCSFAQQLSGKYNDQLDRLLKDIPTLLRDQQYHDLVAKFDSILSRNQEDSNNAAYRQIIREISRHIRQLIAEAKEIQRSTEVRDAIEKLTQLFQICCKVNVLKPFVENEVNDFVNQTIVSCKVIFLRCKGLLMDKMAQYDFSMETASFYDMFYRMKSLDVYLQQIHSQYDTDEKEAAYLLEQFDCFMSITIRPLSKYLLEQARRYMGVYMIDNNNNSQKTSRLETCSEVDIPRPDIDLVIDHSIVRNIDPASFEEGKLRALVHGAINAANCHSQFHQTIGFRSLIDNLGNLLNTGCSILHTAVEETIELKDFDRAFALLEHLRRCVAVYLDNYQYAVESANIQRHRYELLVHKYERAKGIIEFEKFSYFGGKEEVETYIEKLISFRKNRPEAYHDICFSLYRVLGLEKVAFDTLCLLESHPMDTSKLSSIFSYMFALLSYENQIGFHDEHYDKHLLCSRSYQAFQAFLDSTCSICHHKIEMNEDIENIAEELNRMTSGILQLLKQCKDRGMRRSLENSYYDLNKMKINAQNKISRLREVEDACLHFDIMEPQDMMDCVFKLQFLSKQSSLHSIVQYSGDNGNDVERKDDGRFESIIEGVIQQIDNFHISLHRLYNSNQYNKIATALHNITAFKNVPQLFEKCEYEQTFIMDNIQHFRSQLVDSFLTHWRELEFIVINQSLRKINLFDEAFLENYSQTFPPLFKTIEQPVIELLTTKLSPAYDISSSVEDQAMAIYQLKEFLLNIDDPRIHKVGDKSLENLFENLDERNVSFYQLGLSLVSLGTLGEYVVQTYRLFKAVSVTLYNHQTHQLSLDVTLSQFKDENHDPLSSTRIMSLKSLVRRYNDHLENYFSQYLSNYAENSKEENITSIQALIDKLISCSKNIIPPFRSMDIIDLLAGIFAVYSIHISWDAWEVSHDKTCLFRLTSLQIVSICRLLALDEPSGFIERITNLFSHQKENLNGHLLQIEKSSGKSIILGGLACLLAVVGYRVYCLSSSVRLSDKDREPYEDLFQLFGVSDRVIFSTQEGIAEKVINSQCNVSDAIKHRFIQQQENAPTYPIEKVPVLLPSLGTVCLLFEGDILLNNDFYTGIYNLVSSIPCESVRHILDYIWRHRSMASKLTLENILSLSEYGTLRTMFHQNVEELLKQQIQYMLHDVQQYHNPSYILVDTLTGKMIGYKIHDVVSTTVTYRYRTAFAFICESSMHFMADREEMYALQIPCGEWSYFEIMHHFDCILGVTSHFESFTTQEKDLIKNEYNIQNYTSVTPPLQNHSSDVQSGTVEVEVEVICSHSNEEHFRQILENIMIEYTNELPIIVVFPSELYLTAFLLSDYGRQLPNFHKIAESTVDFPYYASRCKQKGTISLIVEDLVYDLNHYLPNIHCTENTTSGISEILVVIQTYFTDHPIKDSEICSLFTIQRKKRIHKYILRIDSLSTKYGFDYNNTNTTIVESLNQTKDLLQLLNQQRKQMLIKNSDDMKLKVEKAKVLHHISMRLLGMLGDDSLDTTSITEVVLQLTSRMDGNRGLHIIFCLDDSGSMMNSWQEVLEAFKCFLTTRLEKGNIYDIISVIQFDHTARVSLRNTSIREAITASDEFVGNHGGTAYYPVLCETDNLIEEEGSSDMDVLVVFMTDGDCIDINEAIGKLVTLCHKYKERNFQFIGVAFITDGTALQSLTTTASARGKLVMARDINDLRLCFQDIAREVYASFQT